VRLTTLPCLAPLNEALSVAAFSARHGDCALHRIPPLRVCMSFVHVQQWRPSQALKLQASDGTGVADITTAVHRENGNDATFTRTMRQGLPPRTSRQAARLVNWSTSRNEIIVTKARQWQLLQHQHRHRRKPSSLPSSSKAVCRFATFAKVP